MSMQTAWPYPCDVHLGVVVRSDADLSARMHRYTLDKNMAEMEKLLNKGVDVNGDSVNHLGQTALFFAALLGRTAVTKLLLQHGANPNQRCEDGSTAVHAAVFSCKPWLLAALLEAGGDLRLHDLDSRTPQDWLTTAPEQHQARMVDFLRGLTLEVHQRLQSPVMKEPFHTSNSISRFFKARGWDLNRLLGSKSSVSNQVPCRGFGKMCVDRPCQLLGVSAPVPVIVDSDLTPDEDEAPFSFSCGSFTSMTKCMWKDSRVTVKELRSTPASYLDLLLVEQDYCCQLPHPQLLQLVAVNLSDDLHRTRLVFERVHVGSLYNLLHHKQPGFPWRQAEDLLWTVAQVCEGLMFLHSGGLVMRALSSHSVVLTRPGLAKLTGLGFMVPSKETCAPTAVYLVLPPSLYNWAAPEAIQQRPCTWKADLYSLCALIQEIYTEEVPWGPAEPRCIKQAVEGGCALDPHWKVPQPHYDLVQRGLRARAEDRTGSLQDLYDTLRAHGKTKGRALVELETNKQRLKAERGGLQEDRAVEEEELAYEQRELQHLRQRCHQPEILPHNQEYSQKGVLPTALPQAAVETDGETETESLEDTDRRIQRIRSNLERARELLRRTNRSLEAVEEALQQDAADRDALHDDVFIFPAVGPPPQYRLQPQGHPVIEKMEVQLLTGEFSLLEPEELSFWLTQYPAEQYPLGLTQYPDEPYPFQDATSPPDLLSDRDADSSSSELTCDGAGGGSHQLICDDLLLRDTCTLAATGRHPRGPKRTQRSQEPCDRPPKAQPRRCASPDTNCVEEEGPEPATWTNYISEWLVARWTGSKAPVPGSSDSEEAACEANQELCRDHHRTPSTDPQRRTTEDESGTDSENRSVGESEWDADFHTVNESFRQTCSPTEAGMRSGIQSQTSIWDEEACPQEESIFYSVNTEEDNHAADSSCTEEENQHDFPASSEEEDQHSTEEENQAAACVEEAWSNLSSVFYSANAEEKNQTAAEEESQHSEDSQTGCAADVTLEVCGPAASGTAPPGDTLDANNNQECVAMKKCEETQTDDGAMISAVQTSFPLTENITPPELAELSSITCSPVHVRSRLQSPLNRIPPLYNSTPRNPAHQQQQQRQHGGVRGNVEVIPYPGSSPDHSSSSGHSPSRAPTVSSIFASAFSALQAPDQGDTTYTVVPLAGEGDTTYTAVPPAGEGDTTYTAVPPAGEGETYTTALLAVDGDTQEGNQGMPHRDALQGECDLQSEGKWPASVGGGSAEGASVLEDTDRAQSTLDEVLQCVVMEGNQTSPELTALSEQ